tara:strand:- start:1623 stop:2168 length:546 start_codon:yes stop_codon:yes gene_type:complete
VKSNTIKVYDTVFVKETIKLIDTIIQTETRVISYDTINQTITHSEYNELFERTLDQKQKHYDSALGRLEWINGIIGIIITIILFIFGFLGYTSINNIKKNLKENLSDEIKQIDQKIEKKANTISSLRYDKEITDINQKLLNLERFSEDARNSFSVKRGQTKPELNQQIETPKSSTNPYTKK